jgi:hypothetical protein
MLTGCANANPCANASGATSSTCYDCFEYCGVGAPTPTPVLVAPYGPALSCEYPNGPIFYYWNYPEPDPPYFGIARTNGRDLGVTPLPAPVWNYTHYIRAGSARRFADTANIQPGLRYDYNVRACHDANCASQDFGSRRLRNNAGFAHKTVFCQCCGDFRSHASPDA